MLRSRFNIFLSCLLKKKKNLSAIVIFLSLLVSLLSRPLLSRIGIIGNSKRTLALLSKNFFFTTMINCICELSYRRKCLAFYLRLGALLETPTIAKLRHAASRSGTCAETNFYVLKRVNSTQLDEIVQ